LGFISHFWLFRQQQQLTVGEGGGEQTWGLLIRRWLYVCGGQLVIHLMNVVICYGQSGWNEVRRPTDR
jgi:hypothetical protein